MRLMLLAVAVLTFATACGGNSCTADFKFALVVTAVDGSTGAAICDATVVATDGTFRETLAPTEGPGVDGGTQCTYRGAGERAGTYTIDATINADETVLTGVVVTRDACHVHSHAVTIMF
jgi:hypothetical protein